MINTDFVDVYMIHFHTKILVIQLLA